MWTTSPPRKEKGQRCDCVYTWRWPGCKTTVLHVCSPVLEPILSTATPLNTRRCGVQMCTHSKAAAHQQAADNANTIKSTRQQKNNANRDEVIGLCRGPMSLWLWSFDAFTFPIVINYTDDNVAEAGPRRTAPASYLHNFEIRLGSCLILDI